MISSVLPVLLRRNVQFEIPSNSSSPDDYVPNLEIQMQLISCLFLFLVQDLETPKNTPVPEFVLSLQQELPPQCSGGLR